MVMKGVGLHEEWWIRMRNSEYIVERDLVY